MQLNHKVVMKSIFLLCQYHCLFYLCSSHYVFELNEKTASLLSAQGRSRRETCGIALTNAVSSCSWSMMLGGAGRLQHPFTSSKKRKLTSKHSSFPWSFQHPRLLSHGWTVWLPMVTSSSVFLVRQTRTFLASS